MLGPLAEAGYARAVPFTPSHVMAVLPGVHWHRRLRLDPTCLVIGSMAPDFEYFARGAQAGSFSHTLLGVAVFGVPVTLIVAALYHHVVKWPVLVAAPARVTPVFARPWHAGWSAAVLASAVVAAVLGNLTHVIWDGLTHANGIFVRWYPSLRTSYELPVLGTMVLHRILQHASSLVGLAGVTLYLWYLWWVVRATPRPPPIELARAATRWTFASCLAIGTALGLWRYLHRHAPEPGGLLVAVISGVLVGTVVASWLARAAGRRYGAAWTQSEISRR